eukprot:scaffold32412_cov112-Isochrysis_galbana.AAC.3
MRHPVWSNGSCHHHADVCIAIMLSAAAHLPLVRILRPAELDNHSRRFGESRPRSRKGHS